MRKVSAKIVNKIDENNVLHVLLVPANTDELTFEEYERLKSAFKEVDFLKSYSSRLTIRLAAWDAVEAAFEDHRVRVVPDEKQPAEKYADIHFSIEVKDEQ